MFPIIIVLLSVKAISCIERQQLENDKVLIKKIESCNKLKIKHPESKDIINYICK